MSKISTYSLADSPLQLSDRLIGTEAPRPIPSSTPLATKNFSLGELLQLFSSNFPAATLQAVLNAGNIATQNITLTGTINVTLIKPTNIEDMLGSQGTPFQVLSKAIGGFNWVDPPGSITLTTTGSSGPATLIGSVLNIPVYTGGIGTTPTLQQVTDEGNTTTNDILLTKETGTSYIQVANNDNTLTIQVDSVDGSLIELNDTNNNNYGSLTCGELLMTSGNSSENVQINSNNISLQSASAKPLIALGGSDGTLTGSVEIKTDLVDGNYTQQLPDKSGTFAMLDDIPVYATPTFQEVVTAGNIITGNFLATNGVTENLFTNEGIQLSDLVNNTITGYSYNGIYRLEGLLQQQILFASVTSNEVITVPNKTGTLAMIDDIPTKTSDLINDGDNGTSHFITLEDLPSNLILYPTTVSSGIGGYNKLVSSITDPDYNTTAADVSTGAITGTDQFIAGLITSPNIIVGNPGIFNITTIGNIRKVSGAGQAEFYFRVYKRDAGGTETLILQSSNTPQITSAIYTEFSATGLWNDGVFVSTDRIVMKFYGTKVGSGSSPTYNFQFGGTQPVRTLVPIPLTVVPNLSLDELTDVTISAPTNNQLLAYTSATQLWENKNIIDILENFNKTQGIYFFEEFMGSQNGSVGTSFGGLVSSVVGAGAACITTSAVLNKTNQQGVVRHTTGTTAAGGAGYSYGSNSLFIGFGQITIETYVTIETLSTLTERFFTFFGYGVASNWQNTGNAVFFSYDEGGVFAFGANPGSPNWKCITVRGAVRTFTTTSIPVVAGQWYKLKIVINNSASSVDFFIDNTFITTHTTNIPLTTTGMSTVSLITKTIGTTARAMQTDYFMYDETFTTAR